MDGSGPWDHYTLLPGLARLPSSWCRSQLGIRTQRMDATIPFFPSRFRSVAAVRPLTKLAIAVDLAAQRRQYWNRRSAEKTTHGADGLLKYWKAESELAQDSSLVLGQSWVA
jgi:hypothetical protein